MPTYFAPSCAVVTADGNERDYAHVAELAAPDGWGDGVRLFVRRELAHAGAPMRLLDHEGNRYQVLITNLDEAEIAYISAMYNGRGRAEQIIDEFNRCGLSKLPVQLNELNDAWLCATLLAATEGVPACHQRAPSRCRRREAVGAVVAGADLGLACDRVPWRRHYACVTRDHLSNVVPAGAWRAQEGTC